MPGSYLIHGLGCDLAVGIFQIFCAQLCPALCNPVNYNLPGSSVLGLLQTRELEWVAMPFSREPSKPGTEPEPLTSPELVGGFLLLLLLF